MNVKIQNPVPGGRFITSYLQATRYVGRGRAHWVNPTTIRFIEDDDHRQTSVRSTARQQAFAYDSIARMLTYVEMRGVPILLREKLLRA